MPNASVLYYSLKQIDNKSSYDYSDEVLVSNPAPSDFDQVNN
jgi:hypothetical protein